MIRRIFVYDQRRRPTAAALLEDPWLSDGEHMKSSNTLWARSKYNWATWNPGGAAASRMARVSKLNTTSDANDDIVDGVQ